VLPFAIMYDKKACLLPDWVGTSAQWFRSAVAAVPDSFRYPMGYYGSGKPM